MSDVETPSLKLSGSSYEMGFEHGSGAKEQVHFTLETYEEMFYNHSSMSWKEACNKALLHVDAIEQYNADYLYEMEGLAKGAGVTFEDILAINARSEIVLTNVPDGCTAFSILDRYTSNMWLAQNWDWTSTQFKSLVHLHLDKENCPSINMVSEAGIIGKIGCNSEGIGVCLNALVTNTSAKKVPIHLGLRAVLESTSIEEAVSRVGRNQMASPAHFLIAAKTGEMAGLEVSPIHTARIATDKNFIAHTNHILSEQLKEKVKEDAKSDSYIRYDVANKLLTDFDKQQITDTNVFRVLSDHTNYPHSICRHISPEDEKKGERISETIFSIVMNLTEGTLNWEKGHPCRQL
ncbi:C45 family autoproteolytic acyltransferase/hydolase [Virgibacillus siamensis]|uniref:C45 family autoproteolytic acyltransferase/hydolase n=1 Tax=Virgibacillus siamensis TaxID=480071 RepID=UPI000985F069|nr:C45 family peptidase [Virgibacillus siamensis]